jgi:hypothetical protein
MSIPTVSDSAPRERISHVLPNLGMIITAQFSVSTFAKRWNHCNQLANYLARFVSANEPDPERQSTLLSTFFNEVLEILYRSQAGDGHFKLTFQKNGKRIVVRAEVPVNEQSRKFYTDAIKVVSRPRLDSWYREWLEGAPGGNGAEEGGGGEEEEEEVDNALVGLLELVAVYGSVIKFEESTSEAVMVLLFDFPYENEDME